MTAYLPDRPTMSMAEVATALGVSSQLVSKAVRAGELPAIRIGSRVRVPTGLLAQMLRQPVTPGMAVPVEGLQVDHLPTQVAAASPDTVNGAPCTVNGAPEPTPAGGTT